MQAHTPRVKGTRPHARARAPDTFVFHQKTKRSNFPLSIRLCSSAHTTRASSSSADTISRRSTCTGRPACLRVRARASVRRPTCNLRLRACSPSRACLLHPHHRPLRDARRRARDLGFPTPPQRVGVRQRKLHALPELVGLHGRAAAHLVRACLRACMRTAHRPHMCTRCSAALRRAGGSCDGPSASKGRADAHGSSHATRRAAPRRARRCPLLRGARPRRLGPRRLRRCVRC